jgi:FkbM family methyltransferase
LKRERLILREGLERAFRRERRRLKSSLAAIGIRVGPQWDDPGWRRGEILRRWGVKLALDVGANVGQYGLALRRRSGYRGRIISLEPVVATYEALARTAADDLQWECLRVALSDRDGTAEIGVAASSDLSSFLRFETTSSLSGPFFIANEPVLTARLDSLAVLVEGDVALMKLDVQGWEPLVLAGAAETLTQTSLIECELALQHLYQRQSNFREMIDRFDDLGFGPISVVPGRIDYSTASLAYGDAISRGELTRPASRRLAWTKKRVSLVTWRTLLR